MYFFCFLFSIYFCFLELSASCSLEKTKEQELGSLCNLGTLSKRNRSDSVELPQTSCKNSESRLLVLGIDGIYGPLFEEMMEDGMLPTFAELKKKGAWSSRTKVVYRPHSSVCSAAFIYGRSPTLFQAFQDTFLDVNRLDVFTRNHMETNLFSALNGQYKKEIFISNWEAMESLVPETEAQFVSVPTQDGKTAPDKDVFLEVSRALETKESAIIFAHLDQSDALAAENGVTNGVYSSALIALDAQLETILGKLHENDVLCITSDHGRNSCLCCIPFSFLCCSGCIPGKKHDCYSCDSVKYTPLFVMGAGIKAQHLSENINLIDIVPSLVAHLNGDIGSMKGKIIDFC